MRPRGLAYLKIVRVLNVRETNYNAHMSSLTPAPPPLSHAEMYVLLALEDRPMHAYDLQANAINLSLGGLKLSRGHLHGLLLRLAEDGYVTSKGFAPSGPSGRPREQIAITDWGRIRLLEDVLRMRHVVDIAGRDGLLDDETPTDIQRLKLAQRLDLST
jgi:DNA-binding PadR family transcriptional regulator